MSNKNTGSRDNKREGVKVEKAPQAVDPLEMGAVDQVEAQEVEQVEADPVEVEAQPGERDNVREVGEAKSLDRFDMAHVRRGEDRIPMSDTFVLGGISKEDGFYYRWVQDRDARVEQCLQGGYEGARNGTGQVIIRKKGAYPMVLMRIPNKYRKEDLAKKRERVNNELRSKNVVDRSGIAPEYIPGEEDGTRKFVIERDRTADFDPLN